VSSTNPAVQVQAGNDSTAVVLKDGHVETWGENTLGELGDGTTVSSSTPVTVSNIPTSSGAGATYVDDGKAFYIALMSDGTVWGWGNNQNGELGDGTLSNSLVPVQVKFPQQGNPPDIIAIAAAAGSSFALDSAGNVWAWGDNRRGQLGLGTIGGTQTLPALNQNLKNDSVGDPITAISAGPSYAVALFSNGTVMAWGSNTNGQLGCGSCSTSPNPTPGVVHLTNLPATVVQISAGGNSRTNGHVLVRLANGAVWGWGSNVNGQLGATPGAPVTTPRAIPGISGATDVTAGGSASGALVNGGVWMWGDDNLGQLGEGANPTQPWVPRAIGLKANFLSAGSKHTASL